ncbi:MAG: globin [Hyphomonadaceae bacterium]|nr:globin [Hyphomonadaceae bacterium]
MSEAALLLASVEAAIARAGDPTDAIYAALFARHPELERLFALDVDGGRRRHMLSETIDVLADLLGRNAYGGNFIASERVNHENLGVSREAFPDFFVVTRDVIKGALGDDWTDAYDAAWARALASAADCL